MIKMKKIYFTTCLILVSVVAFSQWTLLKPFSTLNSLYSLKFTDENTAYAVGSAGTIIKTTNAGTNWFALSSGTTNSFNSIFFTNTNTIIPF